MYLFYQEKEKSEWLPALASERESLNPRPALITVLDVSNDFSRDLTLEETNAIKFRGPLYADFDSESIEDCIPQFQEFLNKLKGMNLDLDQVRLYATGGRGFHVEVPMACFMPKPPVQGVVGLPHIYREMAHALFVDMLDLNVYSAKRGRMWRCANVRRDNGHYKVGITAEEALAMTVEMYDRLTSAPRATLPVEPPCFCPNLGLLYSQSKDKVDAGLKKAKARKTSHDSAKQFKGEWPETVKQILQGKALKASVGWNRIAMQLAITADALGKTEKQLIDDAEALIEDHVSDGSKYQGPAKRRANLRDMYRYMAGNVTYEFSIGGLLALVDPNQWDPVDLRQGDYVPDTDEEGNPVPEDSDEACAISGKLKVNRHGIFWKEDLGYKKISRIGMEDIIQLKNGSGEVIGYDVTPYLDSVKQRHCKPLMVSYLESKQRFQAWSSQWSASCQGSDAQVSSMLDYLSKRTVKEGKVMMLVQREGVDLIVPPGAKSEDDYDIIWSSPLEVHSSKGNLYRFRGEGDPTGVFKSDLHNAEDLIDDEESRAFFDNLFKINTPHNLARIMGWFSASFLTQILRRIWNQFPMLQIYGQAGAGKSETTLLMNHMHYWLHTPQKLQAVGQTDWPIIAAVTQSASIPVVFEEVKGREMDKRKRDFLLNIMRNNYDGSKIQRGALSKDVGPRDIIVNGYANAGPIVFLGEALETQTAMLARCVVVSLSNADRKGRTAAFNYCKDRPGYMGRLGKVLMKSAVTMNYASLRANLQKQKDAVLSTMSEEVSENNARPCYNLAVVMVGLEFLQQALKVIFGDRYEETFESFKSVVLEQAESSLPDNKSEISKVLGVIAALSRSPDTLYRVEKNVHYTTDGVTVDLKLRTAFDQYVRYTRSLGQEVLFDNHAAFISAMGNYAGLVERACPDNPVLFLNPMEAIYRISCATMEKERLEPFEP